MKTNSFSPCQERGFQHELQIRFDAYSSNLLHYIELNLHPISEFSDLVADY